MNLLYVTGDINVKDLDKFCGNITHIVYGLFVSFVTAIETICVRDS